MRQLTKINSRKSKLQRMLVFLCTWPVYARPQKPVVGIWKACISPLRQALGWMQSGEMWHGVVFLDKRAALEHYARLSFNKKDHFVSKLNPEHPLKLHVWGMILWHGPGLMVIFEEIMDRHYFENGIIIEVAAPYIRGHSGLDRCFLQNNGWRHAAAAACVALMGINWVKTARVTVFESHRACLVFDERLHPKGG